MLCDAASAIARLFGERSFPGNNGQLFLLWVFHGSRILLLSNYYCFLGKTFLLREFLGVVSHDQVITSLQRNVSYSGITFYGLLWI
jgi:hypothetical protein